MSRKPSPPGKKSREEIIQEVRSLTDFEIQEIVDNYKQGLPRNEYIRGQTAIAEAAERTERGNYNPTPPPEPEG
ncbi:hypothetical protein ACFL18_00665 [Patescibacteria group bacterium]